MQPLGLIITVAVHVVVQYVHSTGCELLLKVSAGLVHSKDGWKRASDLMFLTRFSVKVDLS